MKQTTEADVLKKKVIEYTDLEKLYLQRIPVKFKRALGDKIRDPFPQRMIRKALSPEGLSENDYQELRVKSRYLSGEYPGLMYIVDIYISPFTIIGALMNKINRTGDQELIKAMLP